MLNQFVVINGQYVIQIKGTFCISYRMSSEDDVQSENPRAKKRRRCMVISSDGEEDEMPPRSHEMDSDGFTKAELLQIISSLRGETGKPRMNNIPNHQNNVIPEFDPNSKSQSIHRWLSKVGECANIYGWDEKQKIHLSLQILTGLAKTWFESLSTLSYSWDQWQSKLRKAFPSDEIKGNF